jgi:thiamine pyrophosphokinase
VEYHRAIVLANGDPVAGPLALPDDAVVIAADGGLRLAPALGLTVHTVVGDMDSVDEGDLAQARSSGARIERHPVNKNVTDLELALDAAIATGADDITIVGGSGGRLDHLLANAMLLAADRYDTITLRWLTGTETVVPCRPDHPAHLEGKPGDLVSLIPAGGPALGVTTSGLRWPLDDGGLAPGSTRGISNEMTATEATVTVDEGRLLVVHKGTG